MTKKKNCILIYAIKNEVQSYSKIGTLLLCFDTKTGIACSC